jgi:NAD(P) transhydrogenase subunit beta
VTLLAAQSLPGRVLLANFGYLASVVMFMVAILRMSRVRTAWGGNVLAAAAMLLAIVSQFVEMGSIEPWWILAGLVVGSLVGVVLAARVKMTQMPEMVALLNGFGGLASAIVGVASYAQYLETTADHSGTMAELSARALGEGGGAFAAVNLMLTILVGGVTFTGSVVAFAKLAEVWITGKPVILPARHLLNLAILVGCLVVSALAVWVVAGVAFGVLSIVLVTGLSLALGVTLVLAIGGGDMPVVISLLNSYSGVAGALAGFTIGSPALVVAGSLVGASGLILTQIMCKSMNRSLWNVMAGGFGAEATGGAGEGYKNVKSADVEEAAMVLADARTCIIVPGYGMAVAQAQHAVQELTKSLEARGCKVRYAVHPVAGRMPGHMNVLLAEASVPYDQLFEMSEIDADFKNTDVAIVIGANDVVNPAAKTNPQSPLFGMPVLSVDEARSVFVIKRSLGAGFAGVKNELFERENTRMIYADGKKACEDLVKALKEAA